MQIKMQIKMQVAVRKLSLQHIKKFITFNCMTMNLYGVFSLMKLTYSSR